MRIIRPPGPRRPGRAARAGPPAARPFKVHPLSNDEHRCGFFGRPGRAARSLLLFLSPLLFSGHFFTPSLFHFFNTFTISLCSLLHFFTIFTFVTPSLFHYFTSAFPLTISLFHFFTPSLQDIHFSLCHYFIIFTISRFHYFTISLFQKSQFSIKPPPLPPPT